MNVETLGLALAAGMLATVNPCGFAMLPAYLALVVAGEPGEDRRTGRGRTLPAVGRALAATAAMALGFLVVFGVFGLVVAPLAASVQEFMPVATIVIGAVLIGLGSWMAAGRELTLLVPKPASGAPTARLGSMLGYGFAYALASLSCTVGPFLAVTSTTFRSGSVGEGMLAYLAYGCGMALVVGVLAVAVALASSVVTGALRRALPYVHRIGGVLVVVAGLYVGYYGVYEMRLFHGGVSATDPIVDTARLLQGTLVRALDTVGPAPLMAALAALVSVAVLVVRVRGSARGRAQGPPEGEHARITADPPARTAAAAEDGD